MSVATFCFAINDVFACLGREAFFFLADSIVDPESINLFDEFLSVDLCKLFRRFSCPCVKEVKFASKLLFLIQNPWLLINEVYSGFPRDV